ncbi:MAG TPA: NHL repeat-containing protein [Chthoniobacterales bacterium]|nr:NHL repeat-containing protein [Chthoniobacterales bacterium]
MKRYRAHFFASLLSAFIALEGRSEPSVEIEAAASPDGKYLLEAFADTDETCRVEVKSLPDDKVAATISIEGFRADDVRHHIEALWKEDSTAFALNISSGRNITYCEVHVKTDGSWKEAQAPDKEVNRVRKKASKPGGKEQEYISATEWLPNDGLKMSVQGNTGEVFELIYRLDRTGKKPRFVFVETIAPTPEPKPKLDYEDYVFSVLAGGTSGSKDGQGAAAQFKWPSGVAVDAAGNVYVGDTGNNLIRKITPGGSVSTLAGSAGKHGYEDGVSSAALFWSPKGVAVDAALNVYVADSNSQTIRKVSPDGSVTTVAGSPDTGAGTRGIGGFSEGRGKTAFFHSPTGVAVDKAGDVYVADSNNYIVRKIGPDGTVTTVAGAAKESGAVDGDAKSARFIIPFGIAVDGAGNAYVTDKTTVRKIDPRGMVTTLAGSEEDIGTTDGVGPAARFQNPKAVAVDGKGNLYVADDGNRNIRKITPEGRVKTIRDRGGFKFKSPVAVAVDDKGWIYVADDDEFRIIVGKPAR